jgi:hypothetical protein
VSLTSVGREAGAEVYFFPRDGTFPREYYMYALVFPVLGDHVWTGIHPYAKAEKDGM